MIPVNFSYFYLKKLSLSNIPHQVHCFHLTGERLRSRRTLWSFCKVITIPQILQLQGKWLTLCVFLSWDTWWIKSSLCLHHILRHFYHSLRCISEPDPKLMYSTTVPPPQNKTRMHLTISKKDKIDVTVLLPLTGARRHIHKGLLYRCLTVFN